MDADFPESLLPCIEDFLSKNDIREVGLDLYPEVFETTTMFPLQRQRELKRMIQIARETNPEVVYEIGADKGGGLYHWCQCLPTVRKVIACEIRGTPYRHLFEKAFPEIQFLWIEGSSYSLENVKRVADFLNHDEIDVLFIDGDKSAFHVDFAFYQPMMSTDGVIFMHDVRDDGPRQSFEKIQNAGWPTEMILDTSESQEAAQRELDGVPATTPYEHWLRVWAGGSCSVGVIRM